MQVISLHAGDWLAEVAPELGGNLIRLEHAGRAILRTPAQSVDPYQFGMPVLLPANRTANGCFCFEGREYRLPVNEPATPAHLHGLVHAQRFEWIESDACTAVLRYENRGEVYPFPFRLTLRYALCARGLSCAYEILNTGAGGMPVTFGLHTTFVEPEWFRVPLRAEQERDAKNLPTGREIPLSAATAEIVRGIHPHGRKIVGYYLPAGREAQIGDLHYRVSEAFDHWILYNAGGHAGILCVEPQCGAVNGLNIPGGCPVIRAGEALRLNTELFFEE